MDKNGLLIPDAANEIKFTVTGEGTNAGLGNADISSNEPFVSDQRKVFQGKALLVIRSSRTPGKITIKAKARGLKTGVLEIESEL